ncbi:hypothetical protein [Bradyrhizobium sp. WSM471]|uniref:hypothetical protein n=1 Tax=Bradyrhizobium sp. WSM471 TaxID=319017 RepID=UPI0005655452|nr:MULTISPECIES: hypothetical protein [Bradyrhizobium]UFW42453.1 hypothetical protein BcanWSM471_04465 [Bradyrhizobium canariense]
MLPENLDFLTLTYGFFNMLRLMSYAPQLVLLAQDKSGAKAISVSSWLIWTGANLTTAVYAWVRLADVPLSLLNAFNTGCCATMLALLIYKRRKARLGFSRTGIGGAPSQATRGSESGTEGINDTRRSLQGRTPDRARLQEFLGLADVPG